MDIYIFSKKSTVVVFIIFLFIIGYSAKNGSNRWRAHCGIQNHQQVRMKDWITKPEPN